MSEVAFVFPLFLLLGVGGTLALYALIQSETKNPRIVDRETAEREVQERSGLESGRGREDPTRGRVSATPNENEDENDDT